MDNTLEKYFYDIMPFFDKNALVIMIFLYNNKCNSGNSGKSNDEIFDSLPEKISKSLFFNTIRTLENFKLISSVRRKKTIRFLSHYGTLFIKVYKSYKN